MAMQVNVIHKIIRDRCLPLLTLIETEIPNSPMFFSNKRKATMESKHKRVTGHYGIIWYEVSGILNSTEYC